MQAALALLGVLLSAPGPAQPQPTPPAAPPTAVKTAAPAPAAASTPAPPAAAPGAAQAPAKPTIPPAPPETFEQALSAHYRGDYVEAARKFYWYIATSPQTADNYPWAQYFLGLDLNKLGFTQAAMVYLTTVAKDRAKPEILPLSLREIEQMTKEGPYDEDLVIRELIYGTDFGRVPEGSVDFVEYYRGLVDYTDRRTRWGDEHFAKVKKDSVYDFQARELKAVYKLQAKDEIADALAEFEALADDPKAPLSVRNEARLNAARLHYERKEYTKALAVYDSVQIPPLDPGRAQIYLERAWILYRLSDPSRSFGYLNALDAPSFKRLFMPDKYLLRALIYKEKCHYLAAKRAAREFQRRFRQTLEAIKNRDDLSKDAKLMEAALETGAAAKAGDRLAVIQSEREEINRYASPFATPGLTAKLREIYDLQEQEAVRRREILLAEALDAAADKTLRAEENLRLLDYEIGLDIYRRIRRGDRKAIVLEDTPPGPRDVAYDFQGEFWNDELRSYRLFLKSRCPDVEGQE
jgi:hypothetical protein